MKERMKRVALTFLIGGATGLAGQLLIVLYSALRLDGLALPMAVLLTFGVVGFAMVLARVSDKLERLNVSALLIAFYGLSIAMAQAYGTMRTGGMSVAKAFLGTWRFFAIALIPGIVVSVLMGVVVVLIGA